MCCIQIYGICPTHRKLKIIELVSLSWHENHRVELYILTWESQSWAVLSTRHGNNTEVQLLHLYHCFLKLMLANKFITQATCTIQLTKSKTIFNYPILVTKIIIIIREIFVTRSSTHRRNIHSGTSVLVGTAIWSKTTFPRQSEFSSRNFSKASNFCGIPLIISRRSTPNITCQLRSVKVSNLDKSYKCCQRF